MDKDLEKAKKIYKSIKIPEQLNYVVNHSIQMAQIQKTELNEKNKQQSELNIQNKQQAKEKIESNIQNGQKTNKKLLNKILQIGSSLCAACFLFAVLVNVNPTFAKSMENIPVLSNLVEWLKIREIHEENDLDVIHAQIPNIANTGDTEFEQKINNKINEKIDEILTTAKNDAQEAKNTLMKYDDAHIFEPINIDISYEIKCKQNGILSFIITQTQRDNMHANVHTQKFIYNIDINQNKELTLEDLLGKDYKNIVNTQIKTQMKEIEENGTGDFFEPEDFPYLEHGGWFEGIAEDQKFYINENGNVVIVFDKYEIAPGYMGMPEFEIMRT